MFAAKYRTGSIAKIFAIAGKDLSKPIKKEHLKNKKEILGQTEEKIYEYLLSIGIPRRTASEQKSIGVPFTMYKDIPKPDIAPLSKTFNPTFSEVLRDDPKRKDISPTNALNWLLSRTVRITDAKCTVCGSDQNLEMHHIRGLKYLKATTVHNLMMKSLNRIQVPLCKTHHRMAHHGGLMKLLKKSHLHNQEKTK